MNLFFHRIGIFFLITSALLSFAKGASTYSLITAREYCDFLNNSPSSDSDHCYDDAMSSDPDTACILRQGKLGGYCYEAIAGRENYPVYYVSLSSEKLYYDWLQEEAPEDSMTDAFLKSNRRAFQVSQLENSQTILRGTADSPEKSDLCRDVAACLALGAAALLFKGGYDYYNGESPLAPKNSSARGNEENIGGLNGASKRSLTVTASPLFPTLENRNTRLGERYDDPEQGNNNSIATFLMTKEQHDQLGRVLPHYYVEAELARDKKQQERCIDFENSAKVLHQIYDDTRKSGPTERRVGDSDLRYKVPLPSKLVSELLEFVEKWKHSTIHQDAMGDHEEKAIKENRQGSSRSSELEWNNQKFSAIGRLVGQENHISWIAMDDEQLNKLNQAAEYYTRSELGNNAKDDTLIRLDLFTKYQTNPYEIADALEAAITKMVTGESTKTNGLERVVGLPNKFLEPLCDYLLNPGRNEAIIESLADDPGNPLKKTEWEILGRPERFPSFSDPNGTTQILMTVAQYEQLVLAHSYYDSIGNILKNSDQKGSAYFHQIAHLLQNAYEDVSHSYEQEETLSKVKLPTPVLHPLLHFIQKEAVDMPLDFYELLLRKDLEEKNGENNDLVPSLNEMAHTEYSFARDNPSYSTIGSRFYKDSPYNFIVMDERELENLGNAACYYLNNKESQDAKEAKEISEALKSAHDKLWNKKIVVYPFTSPEKKDNALQRERAIQVNEYIVVLHDRYLEPLRHYLSKKDEKMKIW